MADRTIVYIIREDAPQQVSELGVVLNRFLGFVRIRYLERVRGKTALRVGRRVASIPENLCRTVREQPGEKKAPSGEPACGDQTRFRKADYRHRYFAL
ncbi:hypothetical protein DIPPA_18894 [Diplonema papillatum]|nr:hypothetical protein DIPPA_18886 [Diplonema papillatum]KAJ9454484.1 hypothetical protein DIPPA_18865 [Diplonema papillatum]KAJ9454486.1 hypothetical protein DIPPA_18891 [Diplonema papillatum]KAJ9454489.1 hypothetical protein DIPPA_18857 [Diplonema papillatum]KAJ9454490.1 hypothetical protein DIPPA_18894 [Diplonema papillatum]